MTTMKAIPTKFNNIQFRSRLEARWAAFFERVGWPYVYEPFDADGYIPDFLITCPSKQPLLVEIKPAVVHDDYVDAAVKTIAGVEAHWGHDVLILGVSPYYTNHINASAGLYYSPARKRAAAAAWWMWDDKDETRNPSIYLKPAFLRGGHVRGTQVSTKTLDRMWREAGNEVQWKKSAAVMSTAEKTQARIQRAQAKRELKEGR